MPDVAGEAQLDYGCQVATRECRDACEFTMRSRCKCMLPVSSHGCTHTTFHSCLDGQVGSLVKFVVGIGAGPFVEELCDFHSLHVNPNELSMSHTVYEEVSD